MWLVSKEPKFWHAGVASNTSVLHPGPLDSGLAPTSLSQLRYHLTVTWSGRARGLPRDIPAQAIF